MNKPLVSQKLRCNSCIILPVPTSFVRSLHNLLLISHRC